jgi:hypothetical protein
MSAKAAASDNSISGERLQQAPHDVQAKRNARRGCGAAAAMSATLSDRAAE